MPLLLRHPADDRDDWRPFERELLPDRHAANPCGTEALQIHPIVDDCDLLSVHPAAFGEAPCEGICHTQDLVGQAATYAVESEIDVAAVTGDRVVVKGVVNREEDD